MNGLAEIEINGEKVGFKFGMAAMEQISLEMVKGIVKDLNTTEGRALIFYSGYCNWCVVRREPAKIDYEVFYDFVEAAYYFKEGKPDECETVMKAFVDSKFVEEVVKKKGEKQPAKKLAKKK